MNRRRKTQNFQPLLIAAGVLSVILITQAPAVAHDTPQVISSPCVESATADAMNNAANVSAVQDFCDMLAKEQRYRQGFLRPHIDVVDGPAVRCDSAVRERYVCFGVAPLEGFTSPPWRGKP